MNDRELATCLAALRYWQQEMIDIQEQDEDNWMADSSHFTEHTPLTVEEIDTLCEKINCSEEPKAPQWHIMPDDEAPNPKSDDIVRIRGEANRHVASRLKRADAERIIAAVNAIPRGA